MTRHHYVCNSMHAKNLDTLKFKHTLQFDQRSRQPKILSVKLRIVFYHYPSVLIFSSITHWLKTFSQILILKF